MAETLLVVEDEPALRQLIAAALRGEGFHVFEARNGAEAWEVFGRDGGSIDLVVTDLRMPHVDGETLVDALRSRRQTLKILCVSGSSARPAAADAFLAKPFSRDMLIEQVRALLAIRR